MQHLHNGDCLEFLQSECYKKLTNGKKVVIVTDPPFNIGYHYNSYKDKMKEEEYLKFLSKIYYK